MAVYGKTWWGEQWLAAFDGIDYSSRLPHGRSYAGNGSVREIEIQSGGVRAGVQGRRRSPYRVEVALPPFSARQGQQIIQAISSSPVLLSRLLNRQLPRQTLALMTELGIRLFPRAWDDMDARCSCPDWAMPCKHIAAVIYLIANEIDRNPFLVFKLHGLDLAQALEDQAGAHLETLEALPTTLAAWSPEPVRHRGPSALPSAFDQIDLSAIPPLQERILTILTEQPLFHPKDFHKILATQYQRTAREAARFDKIEVEPWTTAERLSSLTIRIDENLGFLGVNDDESPLDTWLQRLKALPASLAPYLSPHLLLWRLLLRLALKLIEQRGYLPAILATPAGDSLVVWRPATISEPVRARLTPLADLCPPDLVVLEHTPPRRRKPVRLYADGQTQLEAALHLLLSHFIAAGCAEPRGTSAGAAVERLFFRGEPQLFDQFETAESPKVIRHWLSRLRLSERSHRLLLQVEERAGDRLSLEIRIEQDGRLQPLDELLRTPDISALKARVLADLAVLADYLPQIERLYSDTDPLAELGFSLTEFTPLFRQTLPAIRMLGIQVVLPKALHNLVRPRLKLRLAGTGSDTTVSYLNLDQLLQFDWQIAIGDQSISIDEFRQRVHSTSGIVRLLDQYVLFDETQLQQLMKRLDGLPEALSRIELLKAGLAGELDGAVVELGDSARALFDQLLQSAPAPLPAGLRAQLRPYQQRGYEWLIQNSRIGFGSLIADDMGLGKTLQVICALLHLKETGQLARHKALVVAPTSLLTNWQREVRRFAPELAVQIYHGAGRRLNPEQHDVILTSYGLARSDNAILAKPRWRMLVIDEAQNIKNPASAQTKAIKRLKADIHIGMSGTPVENRLQDYWSLFDFANRGYLGSLKHFRDEFATPIEKERDLARLERFRKVTGPFILRRLKSDRQIISDLPDKIESNRYCTLSQEQAALYQSTVDSMMEDLQHSDGIERRGLVFKLLNALKQICNSPAQFLGHDQADIETSGKLAAFIEILSELDAAGEKALIFTQYTGMGALLVDSLRRQFGWEVPFLHGGLSRKQRDEMVEAFQTERGLRAMILSLKAGGTGLNLTAASQVIHYDLWWNPAVEAQATDRAYRIGQQRSVLVHRMITANTFEEKIDAMIQDKKELAELSVSSGEQWISELSNRELRELVMLSGHEEEG